MGSGVLTVFLPYLGCLDSWRRGEDKVGKTELDQQHSVNTVSEGHFSAPRREASCTRVTGAGQLGPLAFPVTGAAPASHSPAAAGPFPESLKRREAGARTYH